jgi:transcriptional regulator with XRE-family HTH domain
MTPREKIFDWEPDDDAFAHAAAAARRNRELVSWLAQWRSQRGLSQADVAKSMHTSQPAVARLESHQHDPQLSTLVRYITALGLSLEFALIDNESGDSVWTSRDGLRDLAEDGQHDESLQAVDEPSPRAELDLASVRSPLSDADTAMQKSSPANPVKADQPSERVIKPPGNVNVTPVDVENPPHGSAAARDVDRVALVIKIRSIARDLLRATADEGYESAYVNDLILGLERSIRQAQDFATACARDARNLAYDLVRNLAHADAQAEAHDDAWTEVINALNSLQNDLDHATATHDIDRARARSTINRASTVLTSHNVYASSVSALGDALARVFDAFEVAQNLKRVFPERRQNHVVRENTSTSSRNHKDYIHDIAFATERAMQNTSMPLDASAADLSSMTIHDLSALNGVIWTPETTWPAEIAELVREYSDEISVDVYRVRGGTELEFLEFVRV